MLMLSAGIQNAFVQVFFKFYGEIILSGESATSSFALLLMLIGCIFGAF